MFLIATLSNVSLKNYGPLRIVQHDPRTSCGWVQMGFRLARDVRKGKKRHTSEKESGIRGNKITIEKSHTHTHTQTDSRKEN